MKYLEDFKLFEGKKKEVKKLVDFVKTGDEYNIESALMMAKSQGLYKKFLKKLDIKDDPIEVVRSGVKSKDIIKIKLAFVMAKLKDIDEEGFFDDIFIEKLINLYGRVYDRKAWNIKSASAIIEMSKRRYLDLELSDIYIEFMDNRKISSEDGYEGIGDLKSLEILELRLVNELPESICKLTNLRKLSINDSEELSKLPESIGNLKNLNTLIIEDKNNLKELPESICNLKKLSTLIISDSELEELPKDIDKMKNLNTLIIKNANLTFLPKNIKKLTDWKKNNFGISLDGNPIMKNIPLGKYASDTDDFPDEIFK